MPTLGGNYIDLIILIVLLLYVSEGIERGFWILVGDLISFITSLVVALRGYSLAAKFLVANFDLPNSFANALGFILVVIVTQFVVGTLIRKLLDRLPEKFWNTWWSRVASVIPALIDGSIFISALLLLLVSMPISPKLKADVADSKFGGFFIARTQGLEKSLTEVFGGALQDTLTFLTVKPEGRESIPINYKPQKLVVDEASEQRMLELVNAERVKVGAKPLKVDPAIVEVARRHSRDMWERGYFSHINPDGEDPFDRMKKGGIRFTTAGENLALAPTVQFAHNGLMNSEGHKRNILDASFGRIGIGVIDGGVYGKMFTQNFAD